MKKVVYIKEDTVEIHHQNNIIVLKKELFNFEPRINDIVDFIRDDNGKILRVVLSEKKSETVKSTKSELDDTPFLGIFSIVAAVLGFSLLPLIGSLAGLILGIIGMKSPNNEKDRSLSRIGFIMSLIGLIIFILLLIIVIVLAISMTAAQA